MPTEVPAFFAIISLPNASYESMNFPTSKFDTMLGPVLLPTVTYHCFELAQLFALFPISVIAWTNL